ncbi:hypothetical protein [Microvirga puerhi]|uniref:Uncharacterized protein n=1 Tax=Microvirga puerhi TaxID=2876078 RepID=A0ABS7VMJ9_9HYPH|nr:hypothetical protein [Microvirga puerhi]MBZ6076758.1 hypothetical protein [Microvirga puerhi]
MLVLRDFAAELLVERLAAVRAGDFLAAERAEVFVLRAELERVVRAREAALFAAVFLAPRAVDFAAVFLALLRAVDFAADLAGAFRAVERDADLAAAFLAPPRAVDFAAVFLAELRAVDFAADFAAVFLAPPRAVDFAAVFEPLLRDEVDADFAADLRAVDVPLFLAPDFPLFLLEELRRALPFFDLVLVAPESPVNSMVSGFDLSSVGIAASFKGLRVQPSRFEGNVVIPRGFRLTESVESKTSTFSVDTFLRAPLSGLPTEGEMHAARVAERSSMKAITLHLRAAH